MKQAFYVILVTFLAKSFLSSEGYSMQRGSQNSLSSGEEITPSPALLPPKITGQPSKSPEPPSFDINPSGSLSSMNQGAASGAQLASSKPPLVPLDAVKKQIRRLKLVSEVTWPEDYVLWMQGALSAGLVFYESLSGTGVTMRSLYEREGFFEKKLDVTLNLASFWYGLRHPVEE